MGKGTNRRHQRLSLGYDWHDWLDQLPSSRGGETDSVRTSEETDMGASSTPRHLSTPPSTGSSEGLLHGELARLVSVATARRTTSGFTEARTSIETIYRLIVTRRRLARE